MATTPATVELDRPLRLGEVLAAAIQLYGRRALVFLGLGLIQAAAFGAAQVVHFAVALTIVSIAFVVAFAAVTRVVAGDDLGTALARTARALPVLLVLALVVGFPFTIGSSWIILWLLAVPWLALTAFTIPVVMLDTSQEAGFGDRLNHALRRTTTLARVEYGHAVGVAAALFAVNIVVGVGLAGALSGYADQTQQVAVALSQVVLAPFFFIGLTVLYFEQQARALESAGVGPRKG